MVEWLSWLPYKSGFSNSKILETSKDRPNTPPSLKLLEQRVHELVLGSTDHPSPLNNVVRSKGLDQEGLRRSGHIDKTIFDRSLFSTDVIILLDNLDNR